MERPAQFVMFVGGPGTGKTYKQIHLVKELVKMGDRAIIIDPSSSNKVYKRFRQIDDFSRLHSNFKGIVVSGYEAPNKEGTGTFQRLWARVDSGDLTDFILVLDDTNVFVKGIPEKELSRIIGLSRNKSIDIYSTAHSLKGIPKDFNTYITTFAFFPVRGFSPERKGAFEFYESLKTVMERVNKNAKPFFNAKTKTYDHRHQKKYLEYCDQYGDPII